MKNCQREYRNKRLGQKLSFCLSNNNIKMSKEMKNDMNRIFMYLALNLLSKLLTISIASSVTLQALSSPHSSLQEFKQS